MTLINITQFNLIRNHSNFIDNYLKVKSFFFIERNSQLIIICVLSTFKLIIFFFQTNGLENNDSNREEAGHCIWYGECYQNSAGLSKNCFYNGTALPLDNDGQKILAKWCPHMLVDKGDGIKTCCNVANLQSFDKGIKLAANFLSRCPSCLNNLVRHLCEMTCSPNQSKYLKAVNTSLNTEGIYLYQILWKRLTNFLFFRKTVHNRIRFLYI